MRYDLQFEAAYLRAGLLVGLVHERDVSVWAEDRLGLEANPSGVLGEILTAPLELTAMREALRPLAELVEPERVSASLLTTLTVRHRNGDWSIREVLQCLRQLRREIPLDAPVADAIKTFEDRLMLADAAVDGASTPSATELGGWLAQVSSPGYYRFAFADSDEMAAFVAAISRKVVRDRTLGGASEPGESRAWILNSETGQDHVAILGDFAWQRVCREFSPIPFAGTIPYPAPGHGALLVFDEAGAIALGVEDVRGLISG